MESHKQQNDDEAFLKKTLKRSYAEAFQGPQDLTRKNYHYLVSSAANGNTEEINFVEIVDDIRSEDPARQILGLYAMHDLVCSNKNNFHLNYLLKKYDIVPVCIKFLKEKKWPLVALLTLNEIISCYCEQIKWALEYDAVPHIIYFLKVRSQRLVHLAVLALIHISTEGKKACEVLVQHGTLVWVCKLLTTDITFSMQHTVVMLVLNICKQANLKLDQNKYLLDEMIQMLRKSDSYVLPYICWSIYYLTIGNTIGIEILLDFGGLTFLCDLLDGFDFKIVLPALHCLANIARGSHQQLENLMNSSFLRKLVQLLYHSDQGIVETAVGIVSKIIKHKNYIERFFTCGIISELRFLMHKKRLHGKLSVVVYYVFINGTDEQVILMIKEYGFFKNIKSFLATNHTLTPSIIRYLIFDASNHEEAIEDEETDELEAY